MEEKGLPDFIRKIIRMDGLQFQTLSKTRRIHNGDTVPVTKIVKDLNKICSVTLGTDTDYIACIIDLEGRNCSSSEFLNDIQRNIENSETVIGIATRSMENWLLGDISGMIQTIRPCSQPNINKFSNPEGIPHPAEREVKRYWSKYKKTRDGVKFLAAACPNEIEQKCPSFSRFRAALAAIDLVE